MTNETYLTTLYGSRTNRPECKPNPCSKMSSEHPSCARKGKKTIEQDSWEGKRRPSNGRRS